MKNFKNKACVMYVAIENNKRQIDSEQGLNILKENQISVFDCFILRWGGAERFISTILRRFILR